MVAVLSSRRETDQFEYTYVYTHVCVNFRMRFYLFADYLKN